MGQLLSKKKNRELILIVFKIYYETTYNQGSLIGIRIGLETKVSRNKSIHTW